MAQKPAESLRRLLPELAAIPISLAGLGLLFVVMVAAHSGPALWVALGGLLLGLIVTVGVAAARRSPARFRSASEVFDDELPPIADDIHRVLFVADRACGVSELRRLTPSLDALRNRVLVVATAAGSRLARLTGDQHAFVRADASLHGTIQAFADLGFAVSGRVGSYDPIEAADDALRAFPADEIVFALRNDRETAWLEGGLIQAAQARYSVPVRELPPMRAV